MGLFDIFKGSPSGASLSKISRRVKKARRVAERNAMNFVTQANKSRLFGKKSKVSADVLYGHGKSAHYAALAIQKQSAKGKLSARQRLNLLIDEGTFIEVGEYIGVKLADETSNMSAVITGYGNINGQKVAVYAQDFSVNGGSLGEIEGQKICAILDLALVQRIPCIAILDSGGARIQEGVGALGYYGRIFRKTVEASGVIPQFSLILGPCAGGAVYCPALTDFIIMTRENSHMFVTGPDVVKAVTGEEVTADDLGGGLMHSEISGVSHYLADDEEGAIEYTRVLLSFLPQNFETPALKYAYQESAVDAKNAAFLSTVVPENAKQGYDILDVIYSLVDYEEFIEIHQLFAPSAVVGFGRINGETIGVVANQPNFNAGTLDIDASEKIGRFVRFCDAFGIPVITLVDVPGYRPGTQQERAGIIRRGAKVITAYAEASVPLITVVLRKAFGGAYIVMGSKEIGADVNLAWPTAQIAVLGAEGAVEIIHRRTLKKEESENGPEAAANLKQTLIDDYTKNTINSNLSQEKGALDAVIAPADTRRHIVAALDLLKSKKRNLITKKHDNQPL